MNRYATVLLIFDPNPGNHTSRLRMLHSVGIDENVGGVKIDPGDLPRFLAGTDCDFYVVAASGTLLAVASHEDEIQGSERVMWCPVPLAGADE